MEDWTYDDHRASFRKPSRTIVGEVEAMVHAKPGDSLGTAQYFRPTDNLIGFKIDTAIPKGKFFGYFVTDKLTIEILGDPAIDKTYAFCPSLYTQEEIDAGYARGWNYYYFDNKTYDPVTNKTTIVAYDAINTLYDHRLNEIEITYPTTVKTLLKQMTEVAGMGNDTYIPPTAPDFTIEEGQLNVTGKETFYDIMIAAMEALGIIGYINGGDYLEFYIFPRTANNENDIDENHYFSFTKQDRVTLTKISSVTQLGDNYECGNDTGLNQVMWDNPFFELRDDVDTILQNLYSFVKNSTALPYTLEWRGDPDWFGNRATHIIADGVANQIIVGNQTLTYNGGLRAKSFWEMPETEDETIFATPPTLGDAVRTTYAKVNRAEQKIELVAGQTSANESEIAALRLNTDSIVASVTATQQATESAIENINGDINTLTQKVEASMTSEDIRLEVQSQLANGVNAVTTTTGFTFNEEGLTISKTGSEMTTNIDEDGMSVFRDDVEVLTADNEGVKAYNLHAQTYLVVGDNSRFEDFTSTDGEARTGCFWIGG